MLTHLTESSKHLPRHNHIHIDTSNSYTTLFIPQTKLYCDRLPPPPLRHDSTNTPLKPKPALHIRTIQPKGIPGVYAYYTGRTGTHFHPDADWHDQTLALGVATYAIISGDEALLFDAGLASAHASFMLDHVTSLGATKITTVLSHYHSDHVAGASALRATRIVASAGTKRKLADERAGLERGDDGPAFEVVFPSQTYEESLALRIGERRIELRNVNVHTADSTVGFLPDEGVLLAGDTLEDTCTYVSEAENLAAHVEELERLKELPIRRILPAHGCPDKIAAGGYDATLVDATIRYLRAVDEGVEKPAAWGEKLGDVVKGDLDAGRLVYWGEYEGVHEENVEYVKEVREEAREVGEKINDAR
ncbi:hypothetical protein N0V90_001577 [Kalmusia sp. IMI 367209]|nr:hypothetical protein N0V90_001577 [Kalmusia sp. IMI 367209]